MDPFSVVYMIMIWSLFYLINVHLDLDLDKPWLAIDLHLINVNFFLKTSEVLHVGLPLKSPGDKKPILS